MPASCAAGINGWWYAAGAAGVAALIAMASMFWSRRRSQARQTIDERR